MLEAELAIIREGYGLVHCQILCDRIKEATGRIRTPATLWRVARRLGFNAYNNQDDYSLKQVADLLGLDHNLIRHLAGLGLIKTYQGSRCRFVPVAEVERLQQKYPKIPWLAYTSPETQKILGYSSARIALYCKTNVFGSGMAIKRGNRWYINRQAVQRMAQKLKWTGAARQDLRAVVDLDRHRQTQRENSRLYRAKKQLRKQERKQA